jgi:hypothetical protein
MPEGKSDGASIWLDWSRNFHNLANLIVGFSSVQALAFIYSFYGPEKNKGFIRDDQTFWSSVALILIFTALYGSAAAFCGRQERHFLKRANREVAADAEPRLKRLSTGRVGTIIIFCAVELLQCVDAWRHV